MTAPDPAAPDVAALARTLAALSDRLAVHKGQVAALSRFAHDSADDLTAQFSALTTEVRDALDAMSAAPRGPAAPRWDNLSRDARQRQFAKLTTWVDTVLVPGWIAGGPYHLPGCWARHPPAVNELGVIWARWRHAYDRDRPDLTLALEWHDRWLPGAMRRIEEAARECKLEHRSVYRDP